jgi:hypothetical protein
MYTYIYAGDGSQKPVPRFVGHLIAFILNLVGWFPSLGYYMH